MEQTKSVTYTRDEQTYQELFRKIELPLILIDRHRSIRDVNPAFCQFFGYDEQELLGECATTVLPEYEGLDDPRLRGSDPRKNTLTIVIVSARSKESDEFPVELVANKVYLADEPYHLLSIEDGSQKQVIADRQAAALTARNIANLSGSFAHNFNNLLSPILMSAELLKRETDAPHLQKRVRMILEYAGQVKGLIDKLLQFSGHCDLRSLPLSPNSLLQRLIDSVSSTLPEGIRLRTECEPELWTTSGNCEQLLTALTHLTSNACEAMPEGGRLTLGASNIRLSSEDLAHRLDIKPGPFIEFRVIDTGVGIPANLRQRIFEPFFTTWSVAPGRGLGLSAAAGIIQQHGGFIEIVSEEGKGTTFKVYIPVV